MIKYYIASITLLQIHFYLFLTVTDLPLATHPIDYPIPSLLIETKMTMNKINNAKIKYCNI